MVGQGVIAQLLKLPAQGDGHGILGADSEGQAAPPNPGGDNAGHHRKLAPGGGLGPVGLVVVFKDKALVGQFVQSGGKLLVDDIGTESLGSNQNEVFPLKIPGVLILIGGTLGPKELVHGLQGLVVGPRRQSLKVNVQHVVPGGGLAGPRLRAGGRGGGGQRVIGEQDIQRSLRDAGDGVTQLQT